MKAISISRQVLLSIVVLFAFSTTSLAQYRPAKSDEEKQALSALISDISAKKMLEGALIERLKELPSGFVALVDGKGRTLLWAASRAGKLELVRYIAKVGPDLGIDAGTAVNQIELIDGDTPLGAAARKGHEDVVKFLLTMGPDKTSLEGAIEAAQKEGYPKIVQLLQSPPEATSPSVVAIPPKAPVPTAPIAAVTFNADSRTFGRFFTHRYYDDANVAVAISDHGPILFHGGVVAAWNLTYRCKALDNGDSTCKFLDIDKKSVKTSETDEEYADRLGRIADAASQILSRCKYLAVQELPGKPGLDILTKQLAAKKLYLRFQGNNGIIVKSADRGDLQETNKQAYWANVAAELKDKGFGDENALIKLAQRFSPWLVSNDQVLVSTHVPWSGEDKAQLAPDRVALVIEACVKVLRQMHDGDIVFAGDFNQSAVELAKYLSTLGTFESPPKNWVVTSSAGLELNRDHIDLLFVVRKP
jgi:hypothetical protein